MKNNFIYLTNNKNLSILAFGVEDIIEYGGNSKLEELDGFLKSHENDYRFGFLSYDLKEDIWNKKSNNIDNIGFPKFGFFVPKYVVQWENNDKKVYLKGNKNDESEDFVASFFENQSKAEEMNIELSPRLSKTGYIQQVINIQNDIKNGEIEEINFCQEFYGENVDISPIPTFFKLNDVAKTPFSSFLQWNNSSALCMSPERFLKRTRNTLTTQPIKGTAKRGETLEEDKQLKNALISSKKEQNENILTTKAVQSELSKLAKNKHAEITELCQLYSFETVHQLISTIEAEIESDLSFREIIEALFPMGSMTGVPSNIATHKIDKYENFNRGLYSGTIGYIKPNGDFDFNVVIRTLLYNFPKKYLSCPVGGAITSKSIPESEYEECLIKIESIRNVLNGR